MANKDTVYKVTSRILQKLNNSLNISSTKAMLANLRNSIGNDISKTVFIWSDVFEQMPVEFLSVDGILTKEENAIFTALQLYALHQQGNIESVNLDKNEANVENQNSEESANVDIKWQNFGYSLCKLRKGDDTEAIDKRFNAMITSASYSELTTHMRHLVSILKREAGIKVNYALLAEDLFKFQIGKKEKLRLRWGQSYYKFSGDKENKNEK